MPLAGPSYHAHGGHRRGPSLPHPASSPNLQYGPGRAASNSPYGGGSPGMRSGGGGGGMMSGSGGGGPGRGSPGVPMVPQYPGAGGPMAGYGHGHGLGGMQGGMQGGRNAVLLKEAVLLNSLKVLMVMVPSMEDIISKWCGGHTLASPGPPQPGALECQYDDDMAPHIGAQFAM
ncbi:hypothetical protein TSOC_002279, partial [Tetrabaena socialis]